MKDDIFLNIPILSSTPSRSDIDDIVKYLSNKFNLYLDTIDTTIEFTTLPYLNADTDTMVDHYIIKFGSIKYNSFTNRCNLVFVNDTVMLHVGSNGNEKTVGLNINEGNKETGHIFESWIEIVQVFEQYIEQWYKFYVQFSLTEKDFIKFITSFNISIVT